MTKNWVKPTRTALSLMLAAGLIMSVPAMGQSKKGKAKSKTTTSNKEMPTVTDAHVLGQGVIDPKDMDQSVSPRTDFFQYVNGGWLKSHEIAGDKTQVGSFVTLSDSTRAKLHRILENAKNSNAPKGSSLQMIGDFYYSGMDTNRIDQLGSAPLQPEMIHINSIKSKSDLMNELAHLQKIGAGMLFGVYVDIDAMNSSQYILYAGQSGLGLPDRDYYFKQGDAAERIRTEYVAHMTRMFKLIGFDDATALAKAKTCMKIETALAAQSMGRLEMRDPYATYHKMTVAEFSKANTNLDFANYLKNGGVPAVNEFVVGQPAFFHAVDSMLNAVNPEDWKTYLQWHYAHGMARFLSSSFIKENFSFYGTVLSGTRKMEDRWKRVLTMVDGSVGDALGQEYVKKEFTPAAKARMLALVNNLKAALGDRIQQLDWMSAPTKAKAMEKLNTIVTKIGYTDKWKDYTGLVITRDNYLQNILRSDSLELAQNYAKLGKPIDRTEWGMTPPTINAYYNPAMNEIVFPAGILQPPFFDPDADDAVNYGAIGAVIGHELTHGFDDEGRLYDSKGNLKNWWTSEDSANFEKRTQLIVDQFDAYVIPLGKDSLHVIGKLTLGENIADLGGVTVAYAAWQKSLQGKPAPKAIDGFTPEQRFFLGYARVWRSKTRNEALRQQILTNPHSPSNCRVNGPLSNFPEFYKAFNVQPGDAMMRPVDKRAKIW